MRTPLRFSKGTKHKSSMIMKRPRFSGTDKAKYPELAETIIRMSDIILEVLDARFIQETRNPELEKEIKKQDKKIIYVFNKSDLIDIKKIKEEEISSLTPKVFVSCITRKGGKELRNKIKITSYTVKRPVDKFLNKITVGIIGFPNTGKSSVINLLVGKPAAGVGSDAGFTHGIQKVNLTSNIVLLDSPGVIPAKQYSTSNIEAMARNTKVGARSYSQVKDPAVAVTNIMRDYSSVLEKFYSISANGDAEVLMEKLGRQKGFLKKRNEVDEDKTARLILKDWQEGRIK
ncbi:MAG: 50S ribosome-binding GTPase [Candidatus Nanoarchaeia archaeon]|nr:50S ribosome-binding GTPase [Candidatus Nanoarchaeia archaeon]MDD5357824.1 50S ribosome-binding GTPase [Candidatus Nanoarchaeia archaeon]MDD5588743.1 50S ribosome-binding GTPase [Candidatus Nanoarchaeia archaeon]